LGCGDTIHQYKDCPLNKTEPTHSSFTKNYLARYPEKRKYPPQPEEVTTLITVPPLISAAIVPRPSILSHTSSIGRGAGAVLPAWMTRGGRDRPVLPQPTNTDTDTKKSKKVRLYTIMVKIVQQSATPSSRVQPFPIRINNKMPAIAFDLGTTTDGAVALVCLYDTCAAVCSGNLFFHQWVITTYPQLVHSFETFDDANPFEVIKLVGAIKDPASFNEEMHGQLTAVICYHLPYLDTDSNPTVLCIALGADVAVNTILGWPAIEDLGIELRLATQSFFSSTLHRAFRLERIDAPVGIPAGIDFDPARDF
jgi:hypothetical protein